MEITGLDTVFVFVSDMDRSQTFYASLGLEPGPRFGDWQTFGTGDPVVFGIHKGEPAVGGATPAFRVPSLDDAISELSGRGLDPLDEITDTGMKRFATYADPDGNRFQLIEVTG